MTRAGWLSSSVIVLILGAASPAQAQLSAASLVEQQAQAIAPGSTLVGQYYQAMAQKKGDRTDWMVMLESGQCYWFSAAGILAIEKLGIYLWDPAGKRVADRKVPMPMVSVAYCPPAGGLFKVQVKVLAGTGPYALGIYAKAATTMMMPPPPPPPPPPAEANLGELCAKQAELGALGSTLSSGPFEGKAGYMEHSDWTAMLEPGQCYFFIGVGEPSKVNSLALYLWGPDGKRITETKPSTNVAMVGHCPATAGMYKVQAKITSGGGRYAMCIYAKRTAK